MQLKHISASLLVWLAAVCGYSETDFGSCSNLQSLAELALLTVYFPSLSLPIGSFIFLLRTAFSRCIPKTCNSICKLYDSDLTIVIGTVAFLIIGLSLTDMTRELAMPEISLFLFPISSNSYIQMKKGYFLVLLLSSVYHSRSPGHLYL